MTDEEFKKAMNKLIIVISILLILMIVIAVLIFNSFGKSTTIFKNDEQKERYKNVIQDGNEENITANEIVEIENNQSEVSDEIRSENVNTTLE